ncbi:ATP-binding cassette domain-containing protein [Georgenia sp. EYE_87]|uniref:ATP-binding cassette domain-containing protein n=1 Tax=Georgenia sp. EYE_87 TaxID=2853448 RepID=UPI0020054A9A|nr:ATP-binding cassette domain-containing protein [Georgenia sp. EYE_87]MCK6211219.1 ATP-binding cassette domain-containing protein [Georgenia sp. EYE_87]
MAIPPIISSRGLRKEFRGAGGRTVVAVSDLTMDVEPGSVTAFLGPNGAGKSTSLRMLTTLLEPTSGTATVCGHDVAREPAEVRARIGYIGQKNGAGQYQRVRDELLSQGALYGLSRAETRRRADELVEALGLGEVADRPTMKLSGGQRRRVDIALGLIPGPGLLFLDEPSTGLDPQSRANLWEHILRLRERYGMTLLLTTHYLDEADQFAERVMVMDHGELIADDTAPRLKATLAGDRITVVVGGDPAGAVAIARRAAEKSGAASPEPTAEPTAEGTRLTVAVHHGDRVLPRLLRELDAHGSTVLAAELARPTLDDVFLALTGRSLREENEAAETTAPEPATAGAPR